MLGERSQSHVSHIVITCAYRNELIILKLGMYQNASDETKKYEIIYK